MLKLSELLPMRSFIATEQTPSEGIKATTDANQGVATASSTAMTLSVSAAVDGYTLVDDTKIRVASAGKYIVGYSIPFSSHITGNRVAWVDRNGTSAPTLGANGFSAYKKTAGATNVSPEENVDFYSMNAVGWFMGFNDNAGTIDFWYKVQAFDSGATTSIGGYNRGWGGMIMSWHGQGLPYIDNLTSPCVLVQCADGRLAMSFDGGASLKKWECQVQAQGSTGLALNTWYHIAISTPASSNPAYSLHINGVLQPIIDNAGVFTHSPTYSAGNSHVASPGYVWFNLIAGSHYPHEFLMQDLRLRSTVPADFTPPTDRLTTSGAVALYHMTDKAPGACATVKTTSSSSYTLGTLGAATLVVPAGLNISAGDSFYMCNTDGPYNRVFGFVTSYSGTSLVVNVVNSWNSGAKSAWNIMTAPGLLDSVGAGVYSMYFESATDNSINTTQAGNTAYDTGYIYPAYVDPEPRIAETISAAAGAGQPTVLSGSEMVELEANDYVRFMVWQDSGTSLTMWSPGKTGRAWMMRVK